MLGKGEWVKTLGEDKDKKKYIKLPSEFKVKKNWASELVKTAKMAGAKYINITTRHHDGFSLYDTKGLSEYDVMHSNLKRDLIKEFVDECHKEKIVSFFYHTLLDWHNEDYKNNFKRYIDYLVKSIEILSTSYGKIGGFWFDGMWDKRYENWEEDRLYKTIKKYQPEALIINNTGLEELGKVGHPLIDSVTFERGKPKIIFNSSRPLAGEMCQILNDHWGYAKCDCNYKSFKELIENFVDCRRSNCNFLLNTGLLENGAIKQIDKSILLEIGKWIKVNKNFIYGVKKSDVVSKGAFLLEDEKYLYAIIKDVPMQADKNVQIEEEKKKVIIESQIKSAVYLDNLEKIKIENGNSFEVKPFSYGNSFSIRVARITLK